MAQDEVVIKYRIDTSEFGKVGAAVTDVSKKVDDLKVKAQAAFASGQLDAATNKLIHQGDVMGALIERYGSATAALKGLEKEMQTMAALGQRNTKEFKELARVTAELKDSVQDTRGEIKKMASDTRVFDTMVQGARGIAAAFSVATGVAAAFGDENKDLQKTLLKVQGAMAALQGVQELANIATEKGGIATKAYGAALQVVDKISKATGLSMAASWALATAGISVVIAGVVALIQYLDTADDKSEEMYKAEEERQKLYEKTRADNQDKAYKTVMQVAAEFDRAQDRRMKEALLKNKNTNELEIQLYKEKIAQSENALRYFNLIAVSLRAEDAKKYKQFLEDRILDTKVALKKLNDTLPKEQTAIGYVEKYTEEFTNLTLTGTAIAPDLTKLKDNNAEFQKYVQDKAEKDKKFIQDSYFKLAESSVSAINTVFATIQENQVAAVQARYQEQTLALDKWHKKALDSAGDNGVKREAIERAFARRQEQLMKEQAIKEAKIKREGAIYEKFSTVFSIGLNAAKSITAALADSTIPAPAKPALIAANAAISAAALAAALAKPLPPVPKFEKGGRVLAGGRKDDGMLFGRSHRDGGILIEAQGGEYIWDIPTVKKHGDVIKAAHENRLEQHVFHKYVVPQMQKGRAAQGQNESYDDFMLRTTVKNSAERSAEKIVNGIVKGLKKDSYLISRYG